MKTHLAILVVLVMLVYSGTNQNQASEKASNFTANNANLRTAEIALPGMFCPACVKSAKKAFEGMDGVVDAKVDLKTKKGVVIYDVSIISKEQLIQNPVIQSYDGKILDDRKYSPFRPSGSDGSER